MDPAQPTAHNSVGAPLAYLTFDDGPHPAWTPQVLDLLSSYDVTATFFVLGSNVSRFPQIIERRSTPDMSYRFRNPHQTLRCSWAVALPPGSE